MNYYLVASETPFNNSILTYQYDQENIPRGSLVKIPLGSRVVDGCILKKLDQYDEDTSKLKSISEVRCDLRVEEIDLKLYEWMAQYYHYPLGMLIFDTLPNSLKRPRKLNFIKSQNDEFNFRLNDLQEDAVRKIFEKGFDHFNKTLVHGVTGAGKTVIYLKVIKEILKQGKSVLFLLPEINLTPQFIKTFETYLDVPIYQYNSAISNSDKYGLWKLLQDNDGPKLIVGVRSSVFLPISKLGLIIVDEEHDQSFKQDDRCTYNARDIAIKKASLLNIPVILGSATPMVETYKTFYGSDNYIKLDKRAQNSNLPETLLVDMRGKLKNEDQRMLWPMSHESLAAMSKALDKGEQVLVFINKLGYASYLQCNSCGHQFSCPNCSTNLKLFKRKSKLNCQTCEYSDSVPEMCPECMNLNLTPKGFGTEKVHEVVSSYFDKYKTARFDRDEIKTFNQLEDILEKFHNKEIDILVGTQMLSKGHNFQNVNLVIILGIDSQLNYPDFRSNERVYQTLTQVSGRAGRFGKKAQVIIQTLSPDNKIFEYVTKETFSEFYDDEIPLRQICDSPPFKKIIMIYFNGKNQNEVISMSSDSSKFLKQLCDRFFKDVDVLGPRPSTIEKKVNKFTWSICLRSQNINELHNCLKTFIDKYKLPRSISLKIDVDPYYFD